MAIRSIPDLLTDSDVFSGLAGDDLDLIAGCGTNVRFEPGEPLGREGEKADIFYLVREGKVALEVSVPDAGALVIETLGPGDVVGWSWLFPPYRWTFDARAVEAIRAVALDGACLRGKCDQDQRLGYQLMQRFARVMRERLQATRLQLLDVYGSSRAD